MKNDDKDAAKRDKQAPREAKPVPRGELDTERNAYLKSKKPWGRLHFGAAGSGGAENEPLPKRKRQK